MQPHPSAGGRSSRTFTLHGPKSSSSSNSLGSPLPQSSRCLPFRNSGNRVSRTREPCVHLSCNMKTRTPTRDVNGQRPRSIGDILIGKMAVVLPHTSCNTNLRVSKPRSLTNAPPGLHYASRVPHCHVGLRDFADRGSTIPKSLPLETPECRNSDIFGFMPSVPPTIDGSDQIGESHFATLTCM
jgi:hypothetical protein